MIHNQEKYQNHIKMTKMIELVDKNLNTAIKVLYSRTKRKQEHNEWRNGRFKKHPTGASDIKYTVSETISHPT